MRLKIKLSKTDRLLPINNQHIVNSFFHSLIGQKNEYHDTYSNYCVSGLRGGKFVGERKVSFNNGGYFLISSLDMEILSKVLEGLTTKNIFDNDIVVNGFEFMPNENYYNGWNHFRTLGYILLKGERFRNINGDVFCTIANKDFVEELTNQTKKKLSCIDSTLDLSEFQISIKAHESHKERKILVKNVINRATQCQLSIKCSPKIAEILSNVGIGNSTGSGFGTIFKTENAHLYY